MKRRHLLQWTGATIASIGLSPLLHPNRDRVGAVLAQTSGRKLALLVGINQYPTGIRSLQGCVTDVELQRYLLLHRFGFAPTDIRTLIDQQATRAGILDAFQTHLIDQAEPGDVVVFHFSGHGSRVIDPTPLPGLNGENGTIVPFDGRSPALNEQRVANDIMGKTLFLLTSALRTDRVVLILDSCYAGASTRGNTVVRSLLNQIGLSPSAPELALQAQWLTQLGWSAAEFQQRRQAGIAKGMAFGAAQSGEEAIDAPFDGFHAGAFTYLLTQHLWQQPQNPPVRSTFERLSLATLDLARSVNRVQLPQLEIAPDSQADLAPIYFLPYQTPAAEGAIIQTTAAGEVTFWLGGIPAENLAAFETAAQFDVVDATGQVLGEIEQLQREGLVGRGRLRSPGRSALTSGLIREQIRGIPQNLTLTIGLDPSLGRDQREVEVWLRSEPRLHGVPINPETPLDFILSRVTASAPTAPPVGSVGLFTNTLQPLLDTFGAPSEAIGAAMMRLRPRLKTLLAGRLLAALYNGHTTSLKIGLAIEKINQPGATIANASRGSREAGFVPQQVNLNVEPIRMGDAIRLRATNQESRSLWMAGLMIDGNGSILILHPLDWDNPEAAAQVEAGASFQVALEITGSAPGQLEFLVLASTSPLRDTLRAVQRIAENTNTARGTPLALNGDRPGADNLAVAETVVTDAIATSRGIGVVGTNPTAPVSNPANRGVDGRQIAALVTAIAVLDRL